MNKTASKEILNFREELFENVCSILEVKMEHIK